MEALNWCDDLLLDEIEGEEIGDEVAMLLAEIDAEVEIESEGY